MNANEKKMIGLRSRKKREMRDALHGHAGRLVLERGLGNVTIGDICDAIPVSRRTFFNYFPRKGSAALGAPFELRVPFDDDALRSHNPRIFWGEIARVTSESLFRVDTAPDIRELVASRPELIPEARNALGDFRHTLFDALAEVLPREVASRTATMTVSALNDILDPLDPSPDPSSGESGARRAPAEP